jgi:hypothetical protein
MSFVEVSQKATLRKSFFFLHQVRGYNKESYFISPLLKKISYLGRGFQTGSVSNKVLETLNLDYKLLYVESLY